MNTSTLSDSEKAFNLFRSQRAKSCVRQLETGPVRLVNLAAHAVMTEDKFLAAEIVSWLATPLRHERALAFILREELEKVIVSDRRVENAIAAARMRARRGSVCAEQIQATEAV